MSDTEEEQKIEAFRTAISNWKRNTLFPQLNRGVPIETCIDMTTHLREMIAGLLLGKSEVPATEVQEFVVILGTPDTWSDTLRVLISNVLFTDLLEYPLTFATDHIEKILEEKRDEDAVVRHNTV